MSEIKLIECEEKSTDIELFKVILGSEGNIKIDVNEDLKRNKSPEELELLFKDDIKNLNPIIEKVIQAMF